MGNMYNSAGFADPLVYFIKGQKGPLERLGCSFVTMDH